MNARIRGSTQRWFHVSALRDKVVKGREPDAVPKVYTKKELRQRIYDDRSHDSGDCWEYRPCDDCECYWAACFTHSCSCVCEKREDDDEEKRRDSDDCYIATATLSVMEDSLEAQYLLNSLKRWRNANMRLNKIGRFLERIYKFTAPDVVAGIYGKQWLLASFYYPFVFPAIHLAVIYRNTQRSVLRVISTILLWSIFLIGLGYGTTLFVFIKIVVSIRAAGSELIRLKKKI